jgi:urocanate hydratase
MILMGGGSDYYGYLESNFKLLDYSNSSMQAFLFKGANQPSQSNYYLEGFQSPIFCRHESSIVFLDLSNDPPNMYQLDMSNWNWTNVTFNGIPPQARQRYAVTVTG